jgi:general secretion pathway protein A
MILDEFRVSLPEGDRTKKRLIDALNLFLLDNYTAGRNAVLIIDEAQNLSHHVLEQVRLLSNLETDSEKLIQIVLVGQPELKRLLALPSLAQLNQRITVRCHVTPLARREMVPYLACRLSVADRGKNLTFSAGACRLLYRYSGGNPRYINAICDRALLGAYAQNSHTIDARLLREAVRDLGEGYLVDRSWLSLFRAPVLSWSLLAALLALAGAVFYMSRNVLTK